MDKRDYFYLEEEPTGKVYQELIDLAFDVCDEFHLVDIDEWFSTPLGEEGRSIFEKLRPSLQRVERASKWIGIKILEPKALVHYYKTTDEAKKIISESVNSLWTWKYEYFPEDLCFIQNGVTWMMNTAHESLTDIFPQNDIEEKRLLSIEGLKLRRLPSEKK